MKKTALLALIVFTPFLLSLAQPSSASYISLTTSASTDIVFGRSANVALAIRNLGDETAHGVAASLLESPYFQSEPLRMGDIRPQGSASGNMTLGLKAGMLPGSYVVPVIVEYADANGYPFSSVTAAVLVYESPAYSSVVGSAGEATIGESGEAGMSVNVKNLDDRPHDIILMLYLPKELKAGSGGAVSTVTVGAKGEKYVQFDIANLAGLRGSSYSVPVLMEYETDGMHYSSSATGIVKIGPSQTSTYGSAENGGNANNASNTGSGPNIIFVLIGLCVFVIAIAVYYRFIRKPRGKGVPGKKSGPMIRGKSYAETSRPFEGIAETAADALVLLAIFAFLLSYYKPELMLSETITAGGDTASHYYPAEYLRDALLPEGRLIGWAPGWYGGLPMFQFYFIPPFLLMAVLSFVMPLQVAFKLVSALGVFGLPLAAYACMRLMRFRFPTPAIAAAFTLPFLFMEANSMWGGNIPSTLAGEFAYGIGLALTVLFFGTLYRAMEQPEPRSVRMLLLNAALFTLITLSHLYTMLFAGLASAFFLLGPLLKRDRKRLVDNFAYLFKMYSLAFLLTAFWTVPLLAKLGYTSTYNYVWIINGLKEVFPNVLLPFYLLSFVGLYALGRRRDGRVLFFGFAALAAVLLYLVAHPIGIVDIRFVPFLQFFPMFIAACGVYEVVSLLPKRANIAGFARFRLSEAHVRIALLFVVLAAVLWWTSVNTTYIGYWISWNYSGFEAKELWPAFSAVNDFLRGTAADPRVVYEHSPMHDSAGTIRAFESLPLFSGRSTLEGLHMPSTPTSPFVFYIQSQISELCSCPLPGYACTVFNSTKAAKRLEMFNVKQVIARTDKVKAELKSSNLYGFVQAFEPFEVYELLQGNGHYVTVPAYEPVVFDASDTGGWKRISYEWFKRDDLLDVPLIFSAVPDTGLPRARDLDLLPRIPINENCNVSEVVTEDSVLFHTDCVGVPHIVKISYYPNWKAEGADGPYLVSPSFMLVVPREPYVRLYYGETIADKVGAVCSYIGVLIILFYIIVPRTRLRNILKL